MYVLIHSDRPCMYWYIPTDRNIPRLDKKRQSKLLYQDTDRRRREKRQTKLLYRGNCAPKSLFSRKDRGAGRV